MQDKLTSFFGGLTGGVEIDIKFDIKENQKYHKIRNGKDKIKLPVYFKNDDMSGTVSVTLKDTKKYEHLGIKCYLIGYLGTSMLTQKYTPTKISPPSLTPSPKNSNPLASSHRTRRTNSSSLTSRKNTKHSMALLDEFATSSVW